MTDKEAVYDENISPLVKQIIAFCKEREIPFICVFQLNDNEEPLYAQTDIPATWQSDHMTAWSDMIERGVRDRT